MDYKHFGVMLDCSRNAVPKVSALKKFMDALQKMGYNTLELYAEDTYEVEGEPYLGYMRGRYSASEIKELDAYAQSLGIELIPCIQTLAHFTNPVKLARFCEITDCNDILLADDETYAFLDRIFASVASNFTSRNVHIGMDEAHMVGLGKYLDLHGACDRFEILSRHLARVASIAAKYGFTAHMWSDMFFRLEANGEYYAPDVALPESIFAHQPDGVEQVYWDYYHEDRSMYDAMFAKHKQFKGEVWFAGGAWTWLGFAPTQRKTFATMLPAMQSVRQNGVRNVLITIWGDNGGECTPFAALYMLYSVRRFADGQFDRERIALGFEELFSVSAQDFSLLALPDTVPDITDESVLANPSKSLLYADPFLGILDAEINAHTPIPYAEYAKKLRAAKTRAGEYAYLFDTASKLCLLMEYKAYLGVRTRKAYDAKDKQAISTVADMYAKTEKRLDKFFQSFSSQWNKVNKPFGFEVQCARLGGVKQRLHYCRARLQDYAQGRIACIEELEEKVLPLDPDHPDNLLINNYRRLVSPCEI